jgi:hypothetical protein
MSPAPVHAALLMAPVINEAIAPATPGHLHRSEVIATVVRCSEILWRTRRLHYSLAFVAATVVVHLLPE